MQSKWTDHDLVEYCIRENYLSNLALLLTK